MPQYMQERWKKTWAFSRDRSDLDNVKILLTKMACFRQTRIDKYTLELFSHYLTPLDLRAFQVAMARLAESPREEGQTAFPSMGDILEAMDGAREKWPDHAAGRDKLLTEPDYMGPEVRRLKA